MIGMRRRLFWKVYLTLLASLIAVTALMGAFWWLVGEHAQEGWRAPEIRLDDRMLPAPAVRRPRLPPRRSVSPTR